MQSESQQTIGNNIRMIVKLGSHLVLPPSTSVISHTLKLNVKVKQTVL